MYAAVTWLPPVVAAIVALVIGVAFSTYPALRAARFSPIDTVRHE